MRSVLFCGPVVSGGPVTCVCFTDIRDQLRVPLQAHTGWVLPVTAGRATWITFPVARGRGQPLPHGSAALWSETLGLHGGRQQGGSQLWEEHEYRYLEKSHAPGHLKGMVRKYGERLDKR